MVRSTLYRVSFGLAIVATLVGQAVAQQDDSDRSIPRDLPVKSETTEKPNSDRPSGLDHPAQLKAMSRSLNNLDPRIIPFEGEQTLPGPLGRSSREIEIPTGGTVFVPDSILGSNSRALKDSGEDRVVGSIYQMSNGQLKFMLGGPSGLSSPSRAQDRTFQGGDRGEDTATGTELVDPPVMVGGSYRTPLGFDSRSASDPESDSVGSEDSGFVSGEPLGDFIEQTHDELQMLASNSREFSLEDAEVTECGSESDDGPSALQADERGSQYQVSHIRNLTKLKVAFQTKWGDGSWKDGSVIAGKDAYGWHMPKSNPIKLQIRFDCDPGPGANWVTYQLRTLRSPTTVFNKPPTDVFVVLNDGRVDLRKFR